MTHSHVSDSDHVYIKYVSHVSGKNVENSGDRAMQEAFWIAKIYTLVSYELRRRMSVHSEQCIDGCTCAAKTFLGSQSTV